MQCLDKYTGASQKEKRQKYFLYAHYRAVVSSVWPSDSLVPLSRGKEGGDEDEEGYEEGQKDEEEGEGEGSSQYA